MFVVVVVLLFLLWVFVSLYVCLFVCLLDSNGKNGKSPPWRKGTIVRFILFCINLISLSWWIHDKRVFVAFMSQPVSQEEN